eukprot:s1744_g11.t2
MAQSMEHGSDNKVALSQLGEKSAGILLLVLLWLLLLRLLLLLLLLVLFLLLVLLLLLLLLLSESEAISPELASPSAALADLHINSGFSMATASNLSSPALGPTRKLQPNGQLGETGPDKGLREEELQRHFSVWSVSTRSTGSSSDDLNKLESDDEKRHSSTEDGAFDSDDFSEDSSSWETASEGESFEDISQHSDIVYPVTSLLHETPPKGVQHHGLRCHPRHSEDVPQMDRSDGFSSSSSAWRLYILITQQRNIDVCSGMDRPERPALPDCCGVLSKSGEKCGGEMDSHMEWMEDLELFRSRCAKIVAGTDRKTGHFGVSPGKPIEWSWLAKMPPVKDRADWALGLREKLAEALGRPASGAASRNKVRKDPPPQAQPQAKIEAKETKDDKKAKKDKKTKKKEDHEKKSKKEAKRKKEKKRKTSSSSSSSDEKPAKRKRKKKGSSSSDEKPPKKKKKDRSSSSEDKSAMVKKGQHVVREEVPRALTDAWHPENGGNGRSLATDAGGQRQTPVAFRVNGFKTPFINGLYRLRKDRLTPDQWGTPNYETFWKGEQMFFYWRPVPPKTRYVICQRNMASGADLFEQIQLARRSKELMNTPAIAFFSQRTQRWFENLDTAESQWSLASRVEYTELTSAQLENEDLFSRFDDDDEEEVFVKPRQNPLRNPQTPGVQHPANQASARPTDGFDANSHYADPGHASPAGVQPSPYILTTPSGRRWTRSRHVLRRRLPGDRQLHADGDRKLQTPSPSLPSNSESTVVARSIRAILNKLTLERFQQLYEQLFSSGIRRPEHVQILLKEVFDKALVQHSFLPMYADLCARLATDARITAVCPSSEDCFARILLEMCQSCFGQLLAAEDDDPGSWEMYEEGFHSITNIDLCLTVTKAMQEKYRDKPGMTYKQMDGRSMELPDASFNVVIDKACLDSILCGEGSTHNAQKLLTEVSRILQPNGVYIAVSHGQPSYRLTYLQRPEICLHSASSPEPRFANSRTEDSVHYIYVCVKGEDLEESRLRRKHRDLGTVKWIGELLTHGLLRSRLLCSCVQQLLAERQRCPEFVEFAAALLRSAGKTFDVVSWEHRPQLQRLFGELEELSVSDSLSLRLRFLLRDLLELRASSWELARPPKQLSKEARSPPPAPRLDAAKLSPAESPVATAQPCAKAVPFDLTNFRWLLTGTLRDLRADRDAKKAVARLKAAGVPRKLQAVEFSDMITRVAEDASGPARRASFAVLVRLSLGEDSAFHHDECVRGTSIFFREVYADLCDEVPRLSVVMSSEFLPLLRKSWTPAVDLNGFLPKELR